MFERALDLLGPKIGVLYGLTEAPVTCYLPPQSLGRAGERRRGSSHSVGRALPRIRSETCGLGRRSAGARGRGEVLIRGGNVMAGYWQDEAATPRALRDGGLHTGDIGEFDDAGNLSIVGRLKEVIRSGAAPSSRRRSRT